MTTPLTLNSSHRPDGTAVLTAVGEIDMSNSAALATALDAALSQTATDTLDATPTAAPAADARVIVDLTRVEYLDSAALSVLLTRANRIDVLAAPLLAPVLTICGLTDLTTVTESGPTNANA